VSAIEKYGLLEEVNGDKVKVSPLAMSILFPASPEEKQKAINEAAFKPFLFAAIRDEWHGLRPSDENLRVYLIRKKFGSDALDRVIEVYNLCRVHEALKATPAKALGVADRAWTIGDLINAALDHLKINVEALVFKVGCNENLNGGPLLVEHRI
jgi:hypothetical protein